MQATSPFKGKEGEDRYEESTALFVILQIIVWLYVAGSIAYLVLIMNTTIRHTYLTPATMPGTLVSDRWNTFLWVFLFLSVVAHVGMPFVLDQLTLWRKSGGCSIFWAIFLILFVMISAIVVAVLGVYAGTCNGQNQNGNICNDLQWCCAPEIYSNPANLCPNTGMCTPPKTLTELSSNVDFRWLLAVSIVFLVFDVGLLVTVIVLGIGTTLKMDEDVTGFLDEQEGPTESAEETRVQIPSTTARQRRPITKKELISTVPVVKKKTLRTAAIVPSFKAQKNQ